MFILTHRIHSIIDSGKVYTLSFPRSICLFLRNSSWMLYITLQSLGSYPLSIENDTSIHVNFAQQLENLGYWQLAVFVLLHINESKKSPFSI